MSKQKTKKQNPQQAFNEFLFNAMMDKLRAIELYEKEVASYSNQLSVHIKDHRKNDLLPQFTMLCKRIESLEEDRKALFPHTHTPTEDKIISLTKRIAIIEQDNTRSYATHHKEAFDAIYAKMKEQRSDYHDHIRQLVTENEAAHFEMKKRYDMMESADCANLERPNKINDAARVASNAQAREILKMQEQIKGLSIAVMQMTKKPAGRPKKGA